MIVWYISLSRPTKVHTNFSKICVKWPLSKRPKIGFQDQSSLYAGQKYCRMLPLQVVSIAECSTGIVQYF